MRQLRARAERAQAAEEQAAFRASAKRAAADEAAASAAAIACRARELQVALPPCVLSWSVTDDGARALEVARAHRTFEAAARMAKRELWGPPSVRGLVPSWYVGEKSEYDAYVRHGTVPFGPALHFLGRSVTDESEDALPGEDSSSHSHRAAFYCNENAKVNGFEFCSACGAERRLLLCGWCYDAAYCGPECQMAGRAAHRPHCQRAARNAAAILLSYVRRGVFSNTRAASADALRLVAPHDEYVVRFLGRCCTFDREFLSDLQPRWPAIRQLVARESGVPEDITQGDILKRAAQGRTFAKILAVAWCESRKDEKQ